MNKNLINNELKWKLDRIVPVKALRHFKEKTKKKKEDYFGPFECLYSPIMVWTVKVLSPSMKSIVMFKSFSNFHNQRGSRNLMKIKLPPFKNWEEKNLKL